MSYKRDSKKVSSNSRKKPKIQYLINEPSFEWTEKQKQILEIMNDPNTNMVIIDALAGTGKTTLAVYSALKQLNMGRIDKIVYVRTAVEASHSKLGYLKGSIEDKFGPYAEVIMEKMKDFLNEVQIESLIKENKIETIPISFLRGRDLKNCIVIGDEIQNNYLAEDITLATRMAENSKLFMLGDSDQCDLPKNAQNEFPTFFDMFNNEESIENGIYCFTLKDENDIKRSELSKFVSTKYNEYKRNLK